MRSASFKSVSLAVGLGVLASDVASSALAQTDAVTRANLMAYELAMKCFVANGAARGDNLDAGDNATAATFEAGARKSFDTARKLGDVLGYSGSRQDQDFGLAQARELPRFVADKAYLRKSLSTCKAVGLL